jgi:hypothetical protein
MPRPLLFPTLFLALCTHVFAEPEAIAPPGSPRQNRNAAHAVSAPLKQSSKPVISLPPLPQGVEELKFAEFFKLPVGPLGLEMTERLKQLDGKRVRILGHMVKEDLTPCNSCPVTPTKGNRPRPAWMEFVVPGRMMFTEHPAFVSHAHYGLADDLPPQTIFVTVPDQFGELVPFTPGPMLLTGVLSVGNKPEPDGRMSVVRLTLDPPATASATGGQYSPSANQTTANQTTK